MEKKIVKFDRKKHKRDPWITFGILKSVNKKNLLYKKMKKTELNEEISKIYCWLLSNRLTLNTAKSKFMIFFKHPKVIPRLNLKIAGNTIEQVAEFNFLGINIDQNITWKPHVTKTATKISRVIGVLNKLKHIFPQHILLTIYNSLIQPHLIIYGLYLWGLD